MAEEILEPVDLYVHLPQLTNLNVVLRRLLGGAPVDYSTMPEPETYYRSWRVPLKRMLIGVAQQVCMEDIERFLGTTPNEGIHKFERRATVPFGRMELVVNNQEITETIFDIKYQITVLPATVTSHFIVESRGRYIKAENVKLGESEIPVEFVVVSPQVSPK